MDFEIYGIIKKLGIWLKSKTNHGTYLPKAEFRRQLPITANANLDMQSYFYFDVSMLLNALENTHKLTRSK